MQDHFYTSVFMKIWFYIKERRVLIHLNVGNLVGNIQLIPSAPITELLPQVGTWQLADPTFCISFISRLSAVGGWNGYLLHYWLMVDGVARWWAFSERPPDHLLFDHKPTDKPPNAPHCLLVHSFLPSTSLLPQCFLWRNTNSTAATNNCFQTMSLLCIYIFII